MGANGAPLRPTVIMRELWSSHTMSELISGLDSEQATARIFDKGHVRSYLLVGLAIAAVALLYHIPTLLTAIRSPPMPPEGGLPPGNIGFLPGMMGFESLWPLWGQLMLPSALGIGVAVTAGLIVALAARRMREAGFVKMGILTTLAVGTLVAFLTNLSHGWELGVFSPIGGASEILTDAIAITNPFSFISNYSILQPDLSLHAQTQPPGATLAIYFLYSLLGNAGLVSIAILVVSSVLSVFFIRGVFSRIFNRELSAYVSFLFLLLPAVQVYYLANVYALVATAFCGLLYSYLHENNIVRVAGSTLFLFIGTFMSFMFVYSFLFLFLFEVLQCRHPHNRERLLQRLKRFAIQSRIFVIATLIVGLVYVALNVFLGFSYLDALLYASSLENPSGFLLLTDPLSYFVTRAENVLDIAVFFGPVLSVLAFRGFSAMGEPFGSEHDSTRTRNLVLAALLALLLLFLAGAPKKGETARICMFILPILLMPVAAYLEARAVTLQDRARLLGIVFLQTLIMQLLVFWIW